MFSSKTSLWSTPQDFFNKLNEEFEFKLDPCATDENKKCSNYFTEKEDGLKQEWYRYRSIFMNPPYGKEIGKWMKKAYEEHKKGSTVVCLVPVRTDTKWFHDWVYRKAELRFIKGRLKFGNSKNSAPFPSMLVIYRWI